MTTPDPAARRIDVSLVCPTYQEGGSIAAFLDQVHVASAAFRAARLTELLIVDDGSTDGTRERVREAAASWTLPRVVLVERAHKEGTVSAQVAGFQRATQPLVVTMDADGQHPPGAIDELVRAWEPSIDLVVASRYVPGGEVHWEAARRRVISGGARALSRWSLPGARLLQDPLSGFFLARRDWVVDLPPTEPGYKLLLYVLALHPRATIREVPYSMGHRIAGDSKLVRGLGFMPAFLRELSRYRRAARGGTRSPRAPPT